VADDEYEIYTDAKGRRRVRRPGGGIVCDWCLKPLTFEEVWTYEVASMPIVGHPFITNSDDDWAACDECHDLIEAGDDEGLVRRMVEMQPIHSPEDPAHGKIYPPMVLRVVGAMRNVDEFKRARLPVPPYRGAPQHQDLNDEGRP
jgi:hypothetical protein